MADNSIALIKVPDSMSTLGSMLNFANTAQNMQRGAVALEQERGLLQPNIERGKALATSAGIEAQRATWARDESVRLQEFASNPDNIMTNGRIDMDKVNATVPKIAPYTGPDYISKLSTLSTAQTQAENAKLGFDQSQRQIVGGLYGVLGRAGITDPKVVVQELNNLKAQFPGNKNIAQYVDGAKVGLEQISGGQNLAKTLITQSQSLLSAPEQQSALSPTAGLTGTGGALAETITQPAVGGNAPSISLTGRTEPLTVPPTTTRFNADTQAMETVGGAAGNRGPVQTSAPLGAPETASGVAAGAVSNWNTVTADAQKASQDIGVLQEIKKYAPGAAAGVIADRRAFVSGLAGLLGLDAGEMEKTKTDLLAKNSNMLALAGGDTNLARSMAEMANPNTHMTKEAIEKAANQVIAQRQLSIARQQFLLPHVNNAASYNQALAKFNQIADPRILQLSTMSREDKAHMLKAMAPREVADFISKTREMQKLGILK